MHNYCTPHIIKENFENFLIHRCNYILLSKVYCLWQVVKTPAINSNNPVLIRSNEMQQYTDVYLLKNYSTCFGCLSHPSSGVHQIVTAASYTVHITCRSNNLLPAWPNKYLLGHAGRSLLLRRVIWPVPEAAVTVWCTPDGWCDRYPKHVE